MTTFLDLQGSLGDEWIDSWNTLLSRLSTITGAIEGAVVTSSTSVTPATGALNFTTDQTATAVPLSVGATVRGRSAADATKYFVGSVVSFAGTALAVDATFAGGAGAVTDWVIGYEAGYQLRLELDAAPKLGAALNANGKSISDLLNLAMTGALTVGGLATLSGGAAFGGAQLSGAALVDYSEVVVAANSGAAYGVDLDNGSAFDLTLTADTTLTFSGHSATASRASSFLLSLTQDGTGSRTVTWPASVVWEGGTAPTITSTAGAVDVLVFLTLDQGTTWFGRVVGQDFS
ncbi:hypothetical protein [Thalassobaculum sp.]|uniref:hypothetical protein n=1 Tax=Thalassobaculum sp. TaxID=2022740 RepID=UPI0032EE6DC4